MSKQTLIYIAGKVTGLDYEQTTAKFKAAADDIEGLHPNFTAINPMEIVAKNEDNDKEIIICLEYLKKCDFIVLLPDWVDSEGAKLEYKFSQSQTIPALAFENLEALPCPG